MVGGKVAQREYKLVTMSVASKAVRMESSLVLRRAGLLEKTMVDEMAEKSVVKLVVNWVVLTVDMKVSMLAAELAV